MNADVRMFEEWKASNDLLKFYEDLKQKRFAHFITIQTAFLALFALLAKEAIDKTSAVSLASLMLVTIAPLIVSLYFIRVDTRGRAFVDTVNTRLLLLESEWKEIAPGGHFSIHGEMFAVLSRHDAEAIDRYAGARRLRGDSFRALAGSHSAHAAEHAVLRMFLWLWVFLAGFAAAHQLAWHAA